MFNMTACRNKFPLCQISVRGSAMASFSALPTPKAGAGVLELLRQFKSDPAAAAAYGEACLARTRAVDPKLKAFEYLPIDVAPKNGPLAGIPVAIKDIIATHDMPPTTGSPIFRDHVPAPDAWVVERLRNHG